MSDNLTTSADMCDKNLDYFSVVSGNVFTYDTRIFDYDYDSSPYEYWTDFLAKATNIQALYTVLHVTSF